MLKNFVEKFSSSELLASPGHDASATQLAQTSAPVGTPVNAAGGIALTSADSDRDEHGELVNELARYKKSLACTPPCPLFVLLTLRCSFCKSVQETAW